MAYEFVPTPIPGPPPPSSADQERWNREIIRRLSVMTATINYLTDAVRELQDVNPAP